MIKITHIAHACFLIENSNEKLIIDPYDNSIGYEPINEVVNYLLISHDHYDHNYASGIKLKKNIGSFKISKVDSYHDNKNGSLRGTNIIHIIDTEGVKICHLGDLGHKLTEKQVKLIGSIDILLIPVGGIFTIDCKEAIKVVGQLNPKLVIPMHYNANEWGNEKGLDTVDNFIKNIQGYEIVTLDSNELNYRKPSNKTVCVI